MAIGICMARDRLGKGLIKAGPATARVKFTLSRKKRSVAASAHESACLEQSIILASKRRLGPFIDDHP